jgi:hypothetical protein
MAETKTVNLEVNSNLAQTEQAVTSLRSELRKAQAEVAAMSDKFGATSKEAIEAAKRAADLKDRIGDAKDLTDSFNPDSKFKALAGAANVAAGALSGFEGAMALVGVQSEEAQQAILKVQGALALSQGIEQLQTIPDTFRNIKAVALDALKGIKTGIAATGIGLLVVALGTIYAYWDDIKEAVSGVTKEQKNQQEALSKNIELQKQKLDSLNSQDNVLKLQGKSEKEILNSKAKQYEATIKLVELQLESDAKIQEQREKNEERNANILKNIITGSLSLSSMGLRLLAAPIDLLIATANKVSKTLGFGEIIGTNLNEKITEINKQVSEFATSFIFNPDKVKEEGIKTATETKNYLDKLKNDKAGFLLQIKDIDKKAADDAQLTEEEKQEKLKKLNDDYNKKLSEEQTEFDLTDLQKTQDKINADAKFKEDQIAAEEAYQLKITEIQYNSQYEREQREEEARQRKIQAFQDTTEAIGSIAQSGEELLASVQAAGLAKGKAAQGAMKALALVQIGADSAIAFSKMMQGTESSAAGAASVAGPAAPAVYTATKIAFYTSGTATILANLARAKKLLSGGGGAGGSSSGGSGGAPAMGGGGAAPQFNVVGQGGANQIAESMANRDSQPIKAFVVGSDVTTQQGLNRGIVQNATLG